MDRSELYREMSRNRLKVGPSTRSDVMDKKPDTGRENVVKTPFFWWFNIKLTVLTLRYRLEILMQSKEGYET